MIDGLMKNHIDPLWEKAATPLVRLGMSPNQVTFAGLILVCAASLGYIWHQSSIIFGLCLSFAFAFDALDGAVARRRNMCTWAGGYLDAIVDRYQELAVFVAIAVVTGHWALALLALTGGVFTSYAKARTAVEMPIDNNNWPDLFERLERVIFLCVLLIANGLAQRFAPSATWVLPVGLGLYAGLAHFTALQRSFRAGKMLSVGEKASKDG